MRRRAIAVAVLLTLGACGPDAAVDTDSTEDPLSTELAGSWPSARAHGLTIWASPTLSPKLRGGELFWTLSLRTSRKATATGAVTGATVLDATVSSQGRVIGIELRSAQVKPLIAGAPLGVELLLADGSRVTADISLAPRLFTSASVDALVVRPEVAPVLMGDAVVFRARASTSTAALRFGVDATGAAPSVRQVSPRSFDFDWSDTQLLALAGGLAGDVTIQADAKGNLNLSESASLAIVSTALSATAGGLSPQRMACAPETSACLAALTDTIDTEGCGPAADVLACGGARVQAISSERFVGDLSRYFDMHSAQLSGATTLEDAKARLVPANVTRVVERGEDPRAHDLSRVLVLRHPDVLATSGFWYGAYERSTGALLDLYR